MDIPKLIERGAQNWADKVAVVSGDGRFTFQEVNERSNRLANGLLGLGCYPGSHVGILLNSCHQYIEIYFAKLKLNAAWITLSPRLHDEDLTWQLNDSEVQTLIIGEEFLERINYLQASLKTVKRCIAVAERAGMFINYEKLISGSSKERLRTKLKSDDLSRISYTGGTTGKPKGIMISRLSDEAVMRNIMLDTVPDLNRGDIFMGLQPMFHAVWAYVLPCWIRGATQVITPDWSAQTVFETIQKERVTIIKTVPTLLVRLLNYPRIKDYDFSSLRTIIYGGSPMPVEKLKAGIRLFGQIFVQNYGQAEVPVTIATLGKEDHIIDDDPEKVNRLSSVGRPYTMVEVRVVDENGNDVPIGEMGEIVVKGEHVMTGYWRQPPEVSAGTLKDGWVYTRDIGRFDIKGYLYLIDRKSEMIITGGLNVYPNEVEQVLYQHPAVQETAVIGVPDKEWGESIKAFVVLKPGMQATENELLKFCKQNITGYKKPKSIEFRDNLPKSVIGKTLRRKLREPFWRGS